MTVRESAFNYLHTGGMSVTIQIRDLDGGRSLKARAV